MTEIWKPVKGFTNYEVSNMGNIRSTAKGTLLKKHIKKNGYEQVNLSKAGKSYSFYVHRLVADAFVDNPMGLNEVNHKDLDRTSNHESNLEYCTHVYNCNYSRNGNAKIGKYDANTGELLETFNNTPDVIKAYPNYNRVAICLNLNGHTKTSYGFKWRYMREDNADD